MSDRTLIVDDHLLLRILLNDEPHALRPAGARVFTTGLSYHRLCRAINTPTVIGALSRRLGNANPSIAAAALQALTDLPETVGLFSLRELAWPMARLLDDGVRLNLLSLEALAAAEHCGAELCLARADNNPTLVRAARQRSVSTRIIDD